MRIFDCVAWLIILNLALYFKTLRYKFVSDDFTIWKNPPVAKNRFHKTWLQFTGQMKFYCDSVRFVQANGKNYVALVKSEEFEHFLTILIHICICVSIYFAFGASWVSFVAALLYATNPVNNQGTIWPAGRGYALPILSLLLSVCIPLLSPVLLLFCTWYTIGFHGVLGLVGTEKWYLLAMVPIFWLWWGRKFKKAVTFKSSTESFDQDRRYDLSKVVVAIKTFGFYLTLCLIPFRITFYHNFLQSLGGSWAKRWHSVWDRYFWIGIAGIAGVIYYVPTHWGQPLAQILIAYLITTIPYCNIYRANQEIAERFCALPNVFLMVALAHFIALYPVIIAAFLIFYATRTYYTLLQYKDEYFITEVAIVEDPHAWWAWHCRAMKRWDTQSYREALILWVMAKLISPKEFKLLINIASCLRLLGNNEEADQYLQAAEANIVAGQEKEAYEFIAQHRKGKLPILL